MSGFIFFFSSLMPTSPWFCPSWEALQLHTSNRWRRHSKMLISTAKESSHSTSSGRVQSPHFPEIETAELKCDFFPPFPAELWPLVWLRACSMITSCWPWPDTTGANTIPTSPHSYDSFRMTSGYETIQHLMNSSQLSSHVTRRTTASLVKRSWGIYAMQWGCPCLISSLMELLWSELAKYTVVVSVSGITFYHFPCTVVRAKWEELLTTASSFNSSTGKTILYQPVLKPRCAHAHTHTHTHTHMHVHTHTFLLLNLIFLSTGCWYIRLLELQGRWVDKYTGTHSIQHTHWRSQDTLTLIADSLFAYAWNS